MFPNYLNWTRTRACCTPSCRYTRCRRCSCWSGSRDEVSQLYQNVVVNPRGVTCVDLKFFQIWTDLYHRYYNQSKTGAKSTLTSQIKELDAILQKLIKYEPGLILVNINDEKHLVDGDADELLAKSWARCSNETNENCSFTRTGKMRN